MRKLREKALTASPAEFKLRPTREFPKVYGAIAEFPMDEGTLTIVSLCDGNASLYTTGTFGVIGGFAHEPVRNAATTFVRTAQDFHDEAITTNDFSYPKSDRVQILSAHFRRSTIHRHRFGVPRKRHEQVLLAVCKGE